METTGTIKNLSIDFESKKVLATLLLDTKDTSAINELNGLNLNIKIDKYYKKRKLDCNAYMWVLIQKLAEKLSSSEITITKEEIYRDAIKNVGAFTIVPIKNEAVEEFIRIWTSHGIGWLCETAMSKLEGYTNVFCYHGSSVYNQKEMNRLVDIIKQECLSLGIEIKADAELDSLLKEWGN